jgi:hypothetical protein
VVTDVRSPRVVAGAALIAVLAAVAVPNFAASVNPSIGQQLDPSDFREVRLDSFSGPMTTTFAPDPDSRSAGYLSEDGRLGDPIAVSTPAPRSSVAQPEVAPTVVVKNPWRRDPEISWYGPGFYGGRTACGQAYTTRLMGVAHRTLPCGTLVTFKNPANGRTITVPVIDRGPYVAGRTWDLSGAACTALGHCYTGPILWKFK